MDTTPEQNNVTPKLRVLDTEESDAIIADVENFYDYTIDLTTDPNATTYKL